MNIDPIISRYQKILDNTDYRKFDNGNLNPDTYLFQKWHHKVEKGWYGFALGGVPMVWAFIIDGFLEELEKETAGEFKIFQIKTKFGGLMVHLSRDAKKFPTVSSEIGKLEYLLSSRDLIY